ncbi:small integral membrane protein 43 isoform X1 [Rousettus aegyptiacus]|uniref:small integral membrane protein 43 isoform X1 n=1 Tax=Rousettus aegyptiacus TaxID=9407 RepID=UPI00168D2862|nr:small integral membrane protein 43 isoform X1 [Rousettus aegyptiacus]
MPFPQFLSPGAGPLPWAGAWSSSLTDSREQEPPRRGPTDQMGICSPRAPRAFRAPDSSRPETAEAGGNDEMLVGNKTATECWRRKSGWTRGETGGRNQGRQEGEPRRRPMGTAGSRQRSETAEWGAEVPTATLSLSRKILERILQNKEINGEGRGARKRDLK